MVLFVAILSIAGFLAGFHYAGVLPAATRALATAQAATGVMRDPALDDLAKETAVRKAGLSLLGSFAAIVSRSLAALLAAFAPILLADVAGLAGMETTLAFLARWDVIVIASAAMIAGWLVMRRR